MTKPIIAVRGLPVDSRLEIPGNLLAVAAVHVTLGDRMEVKTFCSKWNGNVNFFGLASVQPNLERVLQAVQKTHLISPETIRQWQEIPLTGSADSFGKLIKSFRSWMEECIGEPDFSTGNYILVVDGQSNELASAFGSHAEDLMFRELGSILKAHKRDENLDRKALAQIMPVAEGEDLFPQLLKEATITAKCAAVVVNAELRELFVRAAT